MTAALRKGPATGIAEMIPNTTDFQEANFRGQFSSYPLRKEKKRRERKKNTNGHRTRCRQELRIFLHVHSLTQVEQEL